MNRSLVVPPVSVPPEESLDALTTLLRAAMEGNGPAVLVEPPAPGVTGTSAQAHVSDESAPLPSVPDGVAVVVGTSGSTGAPRRVMLTAAALRASADATAERLGGPGAWLLALPTTHVAGLQVVLRALLADAPVVPLADGPFRPQAFVDAVAAMPADRRRYASLVPTQLHRLLAEPAGTPLGDAARDALRHLDAILVGGAALAPDLAQRAADAGAAVVRTYGMSETCGGCVYDGVPLRGVRVRTDPEGRILLSGRVLAAGYLDDPEADAEAFVDIHGGRWLRTHDLGSLELSDDTMTLTLTVEGRADDVIVTGGEKVAAPAVAAALGGWHGLGEVAVVGVPDPEWGQAVVVVATLDPGAHAPTLDDVREHVRAQLGAPAAPRALRLVEALPLRGPGKPDRATLAEVAAQAMEQATEDGLPPAQAD